MWVVDVHGKCFSREEHSLRNAEEGEGGHGLLIFHRGSPFFLQLSKVLKVCVCE